MISGACEDSYTSIPNTGSFQGQALGTGVTIEQCTALCNSMAIVMCAAFDYDSNQRNCYSHPPSYLTRLNQPANGLTQFRRNNVCGGATTTTATPAGKSPPQHFQSISMICTFLACISTSPTSAMLNAIIIYLYYILQEGARIPLQN